MKKQTKLAVYLLIMCLMASIIPHNTVAAKSIKLSNKSITLYIGQTKTIKLKGTTKKPKWSSSKKSVATVSKKGKIKAKKQGTAVVVAKLGKKKYKCKVKVKAVPKPSTPTYDNTTVAPTPIPNVAPTPIPNVTPTPAVTPTPTVENNYQKLADYILTNGTYDSDNEYYYISDLITGTSFTLYTVLRYNLDGSYEFSAMIMTDSGDNLVTLTITPPDFTKGAVANIFVQSSDSSDLIYAEGEVILSTLTKTNVNITYTSTNASTTSIRDSLYELGEKALVLGLQSWDDMIEKSGLGLSLKDFGFTSYEEGAVTTPTFEPTVENNYQKLADYIIKNGTYDSDNKYYYISDLTTETSFTLYTVLRYNSDGSYEFSAMAMMDSGDNLVTLTITPPDFTKGAVANIFVQSSDSSDLIYAEGEVILSTLTKTNANITYTSTNASTTSIRDSLYELGEKALALGLLNWNNMIEKSDLGLSLKDFGFTSY